MKVVKVDAAKSTSAVGELYFGAPIDYQFVATAPDTESLDVCLVNFAPGGRNKMHTHIYDQVLFVVSGRGIVADSRQEHLVGPGDTINHTGRRAALAWGDAGGPFLAPLHREARQRNHHCRDPLSAARLRAPP